MRAVLTYHSIDASGSPISVDADVFRSHVRWLASGRVRVLALEDVMTPDEDGDVVALTFDDGFENVGGIAAPLLRDHGLPATVFVVADRAGKTNAWQDRTTARIPTMPLLGWDDLARLQEEGISLGAHGRTHRPLTGLADAELEEEVVGSGERIRAMVGRRPTTFAYPFGAVDAPATAVVARSYRFGVTTELRALGANERPALLPRLDMYYFRTPGDLESWGTRRFRSRLSIRAHARRARARWMAWTREQ